MASRRILLVEDSSTMRRMLSTMLREDGFEVETANDGLQGLAKARLEPRPELILTDYEMPELDGAGLCQAVKADKELRSIPVLMLTTLGEAQNKIAGLTAGADDYIEKPKGQDDFRVLCARIHAHLRIADLRGELAERNRLLEAAHKKLTFELELARKVQLALMPRPPKPRGVLRLAVRYSPANQLGGDVYDILPPRQQSPGDPGGRRVGPRGELGHAFGNGQGPGRAVVAGRAGAGRASGRAGRGRRAVFSRRLFLHGVLRDRRRGDRAGPLRGGRPSPRDHRRAQRIAHAAIEPGNAGYRHGRRHGRRNRSDRSGRVAW